MDGREVAGPSLDRGVVFQGHALMPWLTVRGNIAFAVRSALARLDAAPRSTRTCQKYIDLVGLAGGDRQEAVGSSRAA